MTTTYIDSIPQFGKCVILDVDSTLIYAVAEEEFNLPSSKNKQTEIENMIRKFKYIRVVVEDGCGEAKGTGCESIFYVFLRDGVNEFLKSLSERHDVMIWSAGTFRYVDAIIRALYKGIKRKPVAVFSRDFCEPHVIGRREYTIYKKPLLKLYRHIQSNPTMYHKVRFLPNESNAVIVDDNENGIVVDDNRNHIHIPDFVVDIPSIRRGKNEPEVDDHLQKAGFFLTSEQFHGATHIHELFDDIKGIFSNDLHVLKRRYPPSPTRSLRQLTLPSTYA